jgi:hypothetical protein
MLVAVGPGVAAVSIVAFGIVRYSYQQFYEQLGVRPEDVGATSTAVFAQSGLGVIEYSFFFAVVPLGLTLSSFFLLTANAKTPSVYGRALLAVIALTPMAIYELFIGNGPAQFSKTVGGNLGLTILGLLVIVWRSHDRDTRTAVNWRTVAVVWLTLGTIWVNLFYLPGAAKKAGICAATGVVDHFVTTSRSAPLLSHIRVLDLPIARATVAWIGPAPSGLRLGRELLYLGQANGTDVIYDVNNKRAIHFPAADALISTDTNQQGSCPTQGSGSRG